MIPYKSPLLTAVPQTLEKRLEIVDAIRALAARDDDERLSKRRAELASIRRELGELAQALQKIRRDCDPRLRSYVMKYSFGQPRVRAGNPDGGQWTSEGGSDSEDSAGESANDSGSADGMDDASVGPDSAGESNAFDIQLAAAGDLRCEGFAGGCQSGGSYGTTAMFSIYGRNLCMDCAVKILSIQNEPAKEKMRILSPYYLDK